MSLSLHTIGRLVLQRRTMLNMGVREAAAAAGVSPATLSRIERGFLPDVETFAKICKWLEVDAGEVLGTKNTTFPSSGEPRFQCSLHFKKDQALKPETAKSLANLILAAQRAFLAQSES